MLLDLIHLIYQINDRNYILVIYFVIYKKISMDSKQGNSSRLRQFWKNQQLRNYICDQIEQANLSIHHISTKFVYLKFQLDPHSTSHHFDPSTFIFALSLSFPIQPPQIFILNSYITPSLKDYRDLLAQIIGQSWNWEIYTLKRLVNKIPDFLMDLEAIKGNFLGMQKVGAYHPNKYYEFDMLRQLSEHQPFVAFQHLQEEINFYVISVTTCHFLLFKPTVQPYFQEHKLIVPKQEDIRLMRLVFAAEIQSLVQLTHTREDKNEYKLTFLSLEIKKLEVNKKVWSKCLKITRSTKMIEFIIKSGKHFGVNINLEVGSLRKHSEQDELLSQVALKEQKVKHYFNKSTLFELSQTYQKLVEFYSSIGLPYNQIYVHKIATLYHREDVKLVLGSDSPIKMSPK